MNTSPHFLDIIDWVGVMTCLSYLQLNPRPNPNPTTTPHPTPIPSLLMSKANRPSRLTKPQGRTVMTHASMFPHTMLPDMPWSILQGYNFQSVDVILMLITIQFAPLPPKLVGWLSGGFTPCRHLRPSSGREHTIVTYSVRWRWWMKLGGNRPPGDNPLLFSISGTGSFICPVA